MATLTEDSAAVVGYGIVAGCDFPPDGLGYMRVAVLVNTQTPPLPEAVPLYLLVEDPTWAPPPGTAVLAEAGAVWSGIRYWIVGPSLPGKTVNWRQYDYDEATALYREGWH